LWVHFFLPCSAIKKLTFPDLNEGISGRYKISGEIPPNFDKTLKIAQIDGEIPFIDSKNRKMGNFAPPNRKFSAYVHPSVPYSAA
jgi:hypothetical protein